MDQLDKKQFLEILERYHAGKATKEEVEFLDAYYEVFSLRAGYTESLGEEKGLLLKEDLRASIEETVLDYQKGSGKKSMFRWSVSVAAALLVIAAAGLLYYPERKAQDQVVSDHPIKNDIAPGGNKATLTLANGKKISLTDAGNGALAEQAGVQINKTADGQLVYTILSDSAGGSSISDQYNTIETPKGGRYQVSLPDGSTVWLNAASKLTYPSSFTGHSTRRVDLSGEAYFEISKDEKHPFIVKTSGQEVEVLGTHFNINSYDDEPAVKTTLLEGSVKVRRPNGRNKILKPGQQSALTGSGIQVEEVDTELAVAWKNNSFVFESDDIRYIMRMISRWYNVEIEYVGSIPDSRFGGAVSRFDNVSEVLKSLESTGKVKFEIKGRRILVSK